MSSHSRFPQIPKAIEHELRCGVRERRAAGLFNAAWVGSRWLRSRGSWAGRSHGLDPITCVCASCRSRRRCLDRARFVPVLSICRRPVVPRRLAATEVKSEKKSHLDENSPDYSPAVDNALRSVNLRILKTPVRVPQANAFCERLIGTARRECLNHVIALNNGSCGRSWPSRYHSTIADGCTRTSALRFQNRQL